MQDSWGFRAARAAMFAVTCVLLAALGHVVMSETPLQWWALAGGAISIGFAAWIVAEGERSMPFVVVSTLVAQAALHTVFTLAQSMAPVSGHAVHDMHMTGTWSVGMLLAHLGAALLCGLWLAFGERAAFAVLRALARLILIALRFPVVLRLTSPRSRIGATYSPTPYADLLLGHAITSRGPPSGIAAL